MRRTLLLSLSLALALLAGCESTGVQPDGDVPPVNPESDPETASEVARINTQLGFGYIRENQLDLAWKRLHKALEADPRYTTAHNGMALLYIRLGDPAKAEEHFQKAVRYSPGDSSSQTNYGSFLCSQGRYEEGEQRHLQALKNSLYATPEVAYVNAGLCAKEAGELDRAETYLRSALTIDPELRTALLAMSEINFEQGFYLQARAYLQRYLAVSRHNARTLWLGIRIERELGDKDALASYALQLRSDYPDSEEARALRDARIQ